FELVAVPIALVLIAATWMVLFLRGAAPFALDRRRLVSPATCYIGAFVLAAISLVHSAVPHSTISMLALFGGALLLGAIASRLGRPPPGSHALAAAITAGAGIVACLGVYEYRTEQLGGNSLWRVFVNFSNPDFLAGYLVLALPVGM